MASGKMIEKSEPVVAGVKSDPYAKLDVPDMVPGKDVIPLIPASSITSPADSLFHLKGETDQESAVEPEVSQPPASFCNYYYPGLNGGSGQVDDLGYPNAVDGSYTGTQSDSFVYYMPGYPSYTTGNYMGVDGQQPCYSPSGYVQHPIPYGSEAMPCYSWDTKYARDGTNGSSALPRKPRYAQNTNGSVKSNNLLPVRANSTFPSKFSTLDSRSRQPNVSSTFSKPILQSEPLKPMKVGSGFHSSNLMKGFAPVGNYSHFTNQSRGFFGQGGPANYRPNGRQWNGNNRSKVREMPNRGNACEPLMELTCGPRARKNNSPELSAEAKQQQEISSRRDQYNREDFQIDYENAKFYVIKSYSEDDVHKCFKYNVWSSTPNGNKKLDAAFHDAEAKASETGKKCPLFLFYSVNGSGQFIGLTEMIGKVDFNTNVDFWQLDKWSGFFPVQWHIIKDIPNTRLRHITLENNENKPVTFTRDCQEVGFKQGMEMLNIFKSYSAKTSLLDDLEFYEKRENAIKDKRSNKLASQTEMNNTSDIPVMSEHIIQGGEVLIEEELSVVDTGSLIPPTSLIKLTSNLSLN